MKLLTTDWCVQCKPVKKFIEENGFDVTIVDASDGVGAKAMDHFGLRSVPSLIDGNTVVSGAKNVIEYLQQKQGE